MILSTYSKDNNTTNKEEDGIDPKKRKKNFNKKDDLLYIFCVFTIPNWLSRIDVQRLLGNNPSAISGFSRVFKFLVKLS